MPNDNRQRLVFFDLETAGLNVARHPIIQVAAIAVDERLDVLEAFEAKLLYRSPKLTHLCSAILVHMRNSFCDDRVRQVVREVWSGRSMAEREAHRSSRVLLPRACGLWGSVPSSVRRRCYRRRRCRIRRREGSHA